mmetsp:Transcript_47502/g.123006  ORF Transcript_47502/g.123006 Transcript_47502/m.123006 type:complete len:212 (+) Transcript_47502:2174-2809(+)
MQGVPPMDTSTSLANAEDGPKYLPVTVTFLPPNDWAFDGWTELTTGRGKDAVNCSYWTSHNVSMSSCARSVGTGKAQSSPQYVGLQEQNPPTQTPLPLQLRGHDGEIDVAFTARSAPTPGARLQTARSAATPIGSSPASTTVHGKSPIEMSRSSPLGRTKFSPSKVIGLSPFGGRVEGSSASTFGLSMPHTRECPATTSKATANTTPFAMM